MRLQLNFNYFSFIKHTLLPQKKMVFKRYLYVFICFIFCNYTYAKEVSIDDSLRISEFYAIYSDEAKMNWLLNNNLEDVNNFVKKHQKVYDDFSSKILKSNNERLNYHLSLMDALLSYQQNHYQKAVPLFLNILNQKKFVTQLDSVAVIINLKTCFVRLLNYPKAFEMHQLLMEIAKRNPKINERDLGLPLSHVYISMGLISEGIKYLKAEYYSNSKISNEYSEANFFNNLGVVWQKGKEPDSAIYYYTKSQNIIKEFLKAKPKDKYCIFFDGLLSGNIGQTLMDKNQITDAIPLLKKDIYCSKFTGNIQNAAISFNDLAHCYFISKQFKIAEIYLDSSLAILKDMDLPQEYLKNLKLRAELLASTGRYEQAALIYQKYNTLNDTIAANDKELLLLNQQISYQTNKLQEKIDRQEKEMNTSLLLEEKRNTQRTLLFIMLLALLSILIYGYFSYNKSKKREKLLYDKNEEITVKSAMLSAALKEKELLIKEVHHRVKNNMQIIISLLKLQSHKINDERVEVYFYEACSRIQSMALIHEFLYKKEKMDFLQMNKYIEQLTTEIKNSYTQPNHQIELVTNCDEILLDFDTAIPLGLIVNELVSNAYKHAFPNGVGKIIVSLKNAANKYVLNIKDDGVGTPENFQQKKENTLGMELIALLSNQINATVEMKHLDSFEVNISFPQ